MYKKETVQRTYIECDGCQYLISSTELYATLTIPTEILGDLDFHFHTQLSMNDCFRYWAHNPRIMERSLIDHGLEEKDIYYFMSTFLYKKDSFGPGISRPDETREP